MKPDNYKILLIPLQIQDFKQYYHLYYPDSYNDYENLAIDFTQDILQRCNEIFTIRMIENKNQIIGDCALHHWNQLKNEIEIGGSLKPEFWGKGIMADAFKILINLAKDKYNVQTIVAKTEKSNSKAIKFASKLGFNLVINENKKEVKLIKHLV
ncbi:GNAT family N-acetyltransferase [Chryseobacterium sp. GP-SGM7]|uniref:GNAT family N-acetyltransferase n=1 Tax=Chryseobacterium sp. GP-SGM7 TaxID=3411323 RepID=UPI003B935B2F